MSTLRVWHIPQVPMAPFHVEVPDLASARLVSDALAEYDLFQLRHRIKPDYCNAQGIERRVAGAWEEVDEEADEDLREAGICTVRYKDRVDDVVALPDMFCSERVGESLRVMVEAPARRPKRSRAG